MLYSCVVIEALRGTLTKLSFKQPGREVKEFLTVTLYVCMYLLIGKGQSAQKRPYWGEDRIKRKIYE